MAPQLVDARVRLDLPLLGLLLDLALSDDEGRGQPPVLFVVAEQLHPGEDGPAHAAGRVLEDGLRAEDVLK